MHFKILRQTVDKCLRRMRFREIRLMLVILVMATVQVFAAGFSQEVTLTATNESLAVIFDKVKSQTGYRIVYNTEILSTSVPVTITLKQASLTEAMRQILANQPLNYELRENTILIFPKVAKATVRQNALQQRQVSGKVANTARQPLIGATVLNQSTSRQASTGNDGGFSIPANTGDVLVFRMVGYEPTERKVGTQSLMDVMLTESVTALEEVVVNTGYQKLSKRLFTGASAKVNGVDAQRAGVPDATRMLEGQVAGVTLQNVSGTFGAAPKIRIRGATSLTGDNKPLWVIDGVIMEDVVNISNEQLTSGDPNTLIGSSIAGLNPDDIESMEILKDAAATAMYGARAMNGVVVVTTKRGRVSDGKALFSYTGNFSSYLKPTYGQFDIMNSADQMSVYMDLLNKGWLNHAETSRASEGGVFTKMYNEMYSYDEATQSFGLRNDLASQESFLKRYAMANTDWFDLLFRNSLLQEHSVSATGGTENTQLYFSTSYMDDSGWTIADKAKRYTGNMRGSFKLNNRLNVELIGAGYIRDQQVPGTQTRFNNSLTGEFNRDFDINPLSYARNTSRTLTAYDENGNLEYFTRGYAPFNILNEVDNNYMNVDGVDFRVQGDIGYKILKSLTYNVIGSYRYSKTTREHHITENSNFAEAYRANYDNVIADGNPLLYRDPDRPRDLPAIILPYGGFYKTFDDRMKSYLLRQSLDWTASFGTIHDLNVYGLAEIRSIDRQNRNADGVGYQYERGGVSLFDPSYFKQQSENGFDYFGMGYDRERYLAYALRGAYAFKKRYVINGTLRYDGSNKLGNSPSARWLPTWNASAAWNVEEEPFFKPLMSKISQLRVRGTYGLVASLGAANNSAVVMINQNSNRRFFDINETGLSISALENSELTWEKQYEANAGLDLGFLDNRITVTADFYDRKGFDLIGLFRTGGIGGQALKLANYADMKSQGFELTVGGRIIKNQNFLWRSQFNFANHRSEITNLVNDPRIWDLVVADGGMRLGYPVRSLFSVQYAGLRPESGIPYFINEKGEESERMDLRSLDVDHLKYEGPVDPTFTGGYYNLVSYKNLDFSFLLTFSAGNKVRLDPSFSDRYSDLDATSKDFLNRWMVPGDETQTNVPAIANRTAVSRLGSAYPYNYYNYSDVRVADGGFVRLKQVSLTYRVPVGWVTKARFSSAALSLTGQNLWLIYSDSRLNGQDPEFFGSGGVALPVPRQVSLQLKLGF